MDIVKKNVVSIIFGVIALVAMVLAFFPMGGKFDEINKELDERAKCYQQAEAIVKKPRTLPDIDLVSTAEPKPLKYFPSPKITSLAKNFMDQLISQSRGVLETAVQMNQRESVVGPKNSLLLTPGSLPEPQPNTDNSFKKMLQPEMDELRLKVLEAGFPPTVEEIKKVDDKVLLDNNAKRVIGADGQAINEAAVQEAYQKESALLPAKMRTEVANKCRIYIDPEVLAAPKEITAVPQSPSPSQIWYAQATLWLQEDVCRAISEVNKSSRNVQESPIKRLVAFTIPAGPAMYVRSAAGPESAAGGETATNVRGGGGVTAGDAGAPSNGEPARVFTVSPTGRASNILYDVIGFTLVLHVDQTKVPAILKQLSKDRFITVRNVDLNRLDLTTLVDQGFVYGSAPIAEITIDCEAIQMREWTAPLMPRVIKDALIGPGVEFVSQLKLADKPAQ